MLVVPAPSMARTLNVHGPSARGPNACPEVQAVKVSAVAGVVVGTSEHW